MMGGTLSEVMRREAGLFIWDLALSTSRMSFLTELSVSLDENPSTQLCEARGEQRGQECTNCQLPPPNCSLQYPLLSQCFLFIIHKAPVLCEEGTLSNYIR